MPRERTVMEEVRIRGTQGTEEFKGKGEGQREEKSWGKKGQERSERRCEVGKKGGENINRGFWEKIAACFIGQLSWGITGSLQRKDEKKRMTKKIQRRFPSKLPGKH